MSDRVKEWLLWGCMLAGSAGFFALVANLAFAPAARGPHVTLPGDVSAAVDDYAAVKAVTADPEVRWVVLDRGLSMLPPELFRDSYTVMVKAKAPGRYRVAALTARGSRVSEAAVCTVVVGQPGPVPPVPPGPGPGPPVDPFAAAVKAAFDADPAPDKAAKALLLAGVYRALGETVGTASELKTAGDIADAQRAAVGGVLGAGDLKGVRQAVAAELAKTLPATAETPATPEVKSKAATAFRRVADVLGGLR